MNKAEQHTKHAYWYYVPPALLLVWLILGAIHAPIGDFGNYYYASRFLLEGRWATWIYDPASFNLVVYGEGQRNFFLNYTPVPPFSALCYLPFTWMDAVVAKLCWNSLNSLLFLVTLYRVQRHVQFTPWLIAVIPVLFFTPLRTIIYEGQSYFLLLFLLGEGLVRYERGEKWIAVFVWALAVHLKITPLFAGLFLLTIRDVKSVFRFLLAIAALFAVSVPAISSSVWAHYGIDILPRLFHGEVNNTYALNYQSMQVLLKTLFVPDVLHNLHPRYDDPALYQHILLTWKIFISGLALCCSFTRISNAHKFSIWLLASLLVSGYGNSFSLILLMIPFVTLTASFGGNRKVLVLAAALVLLICNVPVYKFNGLPLLLQFPRLYVLLTAYLCYVMLTGVRVRAVYLLVFIPAWFIPVQTGVYHQNYLLQKEEALLIYRMNLSGRVLHLSFFDAGGPGEKNVLLPVDAIRSRPADAPVLVNGREQVRQPVLVNDSLLIYLSDKNRGVGFYTVRYEYINHERNTGNR